MAKDPARPPVRPDATLGLLGSLAGGRRHQGGLMAVEDLGARQLAGLGRLASRLESEHVAYWLFGGWAVDFHAGSITRGHDDVDVAIWLEDRQRVARLLEADGWRHAPAGDEDGGTGYERGDVRLELTYLTRDAAGEVFIPLRNGPVPWARESFADDVRELSGVRARVITLASLRSMKSWPRDDPEDAAKDRADLAALPSAPGGDARR